MTPFVQLGDLRLQSRRFLVYHLFQVGLFRLQGGNCGLEVAKPGGVARLPLLYLLRPSGELTQLLGGGAVGRLQCTIAAGKVRELLGRGVVQRSSGGSAGGGGGGGGRLLFEGLQAAGYIVVPRMEVM